ncbi:MAG: hypothetical protein NTZ05_20570 [Chloroflexi bacterium]|nr:hypothetical protein [Chloroflexota bacterium]
MANSTAYNHLREHLQTAARTRETTTYAALAPLAGFFRCARGLGASAGDDDAAFWTEELARVYRYGAAA